LDNEELTRIVRLNRSTYTLVQLEKAVSSCELCAFPPEWPFEPCGFAQCRRLWHRKFLTFASRQARFNVPEIDVLPAYFPLARSKPIRWRFWFCLLPVGFDPVENL